MMQPWFRDGKLGIFIHWGIYSVNGIPESWSFFNGQIGYEDYMRQLDGFTAANFDADAWADLFARVGATYAVLTSKHHDGVALFDTAANDLSVVKRTPAKRDLVREYLEALRRKGLRTGLYFSHLDWSHPDYATVRKPGMPAEERGNPFAYPAAGEEDPARWENFLRFHRQQLRELCTQYGTLDLLWFDGEWERTLAQWRFDEVAADLRAWQPEMVVNGRLTGHGDYETPEQGQPIVAPSGDWEFCATVNDSWGYQVQDHNHKPVRELVRMFAEVVGMGGNLLLDIGPKEDGTLLPEQIERLEGLGRWVRKHAEAIYGSRTGLPAGHFYGASTLSPDKTTLFLTFFDRPFDEVFVKGIRNKVRRATVVGDGREVTFRRSTGADWLEVPGPLAFRVPEDALDADATVLKVELEGPLNLYRGAGREVVVD